MRHHRKSRLLAVLLAGALVAAGCGGDDDTGSNDNGGDNGGNGGETSGAFIDPAQDCAEDWDGTTGVEGDVIRLGTISPKTGAITATIYDLVTQGMKAKFKYVNENEGGVTAGDGKKYRIELEEGDDSYDASKTPQVARDLVENKKIFAMVGEIGTETGLAVRSYMNEQCVPSIALGTGSPEWGKNDASPWYVGGLPSYAMEAVAFLDYYTTVKPDATIAILYQNDDFGTSYLNAMKKWIEDNDSEMSVVAEEPFDIKSGQNPESAITSLSQSKADLLFVGISGSSCAQSLTFVPANWTPDRYLGITCSVKTALSFGGDAVQGVYTSQATLDPSSPTDQQHPRLQEYFTQGQAAGLTQDQLQDGIHAAGWGFASILIEALKLTPEVTRDALMNTIWKLDIDESIGLLRDGQVIKTNETEDPWIIEGVRIVKREGDDWVEANPLTDYNGRSNEFAGIN